MMEQILHERITDLEKKIKRIKNQTAPTVPIYDLTAAVPAAPVFVMRASAGNGTFTSGSAYGGVVFTPPVGDIWLYYRLRFMSQLLTDLWAGPGTGSGPVTTLKGVSGDNLVLNPNGSPAPWDWETFYGDTGVVATGDIWHIVEAHFDGTNITWYMDGTIIAGPSNALSFGGLVGSNFLFGVIGFPGDIPATDYVYIGDIRVGTTRGAIDLTSADFSTGDLSQLDGTNVSHGFTLDVIPDF